MPKRLLLLLSGMLLVIVVLATLIPEDAGAIPAFARRYKISCTTCHAPFPRLKDFGNEFAGNGFIIPEDEKPRDYVSAGDDLLSLNRTFPIAVRFDAFGVYDDEVFVASDLQIPWGLKLLSGGAIGQGVGYYFYFYMNERGDIAGIEDAYIHFNDIFGSNLDVMVGQFQVSDPLMKRELRLTFEDYVAYTTRVGLSTINLTYDRGGMFTYGIDATKTDLVFEVVNGNGRAAANELTRQFDDDPNKSVAFRLLQGMGDVVGLGGFVYYGNEKLAPDTPNGGTANEVLYLGLDGMLSLGKFDLTAQYLYREDTNPLFRQPPPAANVKTDGWIGELVFGPGGENGRHWVTLLYNLVASGIDFDDYEAASASYTFLLRRNLRLTAEYTRIFKVNQVEFTGSGGGESKADDGIEVVTREDFNRFVVGIVSGF